MRRKFDEGQGSAELIVIALYEIVVPSLVRYLGLIAETEIGLEAIL
jgi:hypothetical protein